MKVIIPTALRKHTGGQNHLSIAATTVQDALEQVVTAHPQLRSSLFDDRNQLVSYVNVFVNDRNIRDLENEATPLRETDEILLVPAIAGG
ncbi:Sulfur carrier protein CysO [Stieleria maiorica]|uniref:Sulfur carrier protein CysO n=1 Tax=Stieleria maiorica TaxID=2795974 RepID=A0A5B9MRT8_9BACT|nr:MoaD/ThiS family protein [Stieleria maiorica]QEG01748.1 Sulfur carrier protein CysO [Stieleria maiorica]